MVLSRVWIVPVATFVLILATFIISYAVAVGNDHVTAFLPYISDIATVAPESCIFAQLLNIASLLVGLCMYWRHRGIVAFYGHLHKIEGTAWRTVSVWFLRIGFLCATGMSIVANFQSDDFKQMHFIGAFFTFFFGLVYLWGQTVFSYYMKPQMNDRILSHVRMVITVIATIFFIISMSTDYAHHILSRGPHDTAILSTTDKLHFSPNDEGYGARITSSITEWLMAFCFCAYILSFAFELRYAELKPLKLVLPGSPLAQQRVEEAAIASAPDIPARNRFFTDATDDGAPSTEGNISPLAYELVR